MHKYVQPQTSLDFNRSVRTLTFNKYDSTLRFSHLITMSGSFTELGYWRLSAKCLVVLFSALYLYVWLTSWCRLIMTRFPAVKSLKTTWIVSNVVTCLVPRPRPRCMGTYHEVHLLGVILLIGSLITISKQKWNLVILSTMLYYQLFVVFELTTDQSFHVYRK